MDETKNTKSRDSTNKISIEQNNLVNLNFFKSKYKISARINKLNIAYYLT